MQQAEIKDLLLELAQDKCTFERHQAVSKMFYEAAKRKPAPDSTYDDTSALFATMLNRLLRIANKKQLPGLFPFFAMLCGDRSGLDVLAEIDWSLMS